MSLPAGTSPSTPKEQTTTTTDLCLLGRVEEVHDDVEGLDDAAGGVDGDEQELVGLEQRVVDPQHGAEEGHHVRHRLEPLRRLALVDPVERRPA